jgi:hypothetical protein
MRSGQVMDRRYLGDDSGSKPLASAAAGPLHCAVYRMWATGETGGGNYGRKSKKSMDSSTVRTRKLCQLYNVHLHPKLSMTSAPAPSGRLSKEILDLQD